MRSLTNRLAVVLATVAVVSAPAVSAAALAAVPPSSATAAAGPPGAFEIVGHDPLMNRGMNAALAVHGDYGYVGSRTDGKLDNINSAGIMVVDISDPTDPRVVNQIGPPWEGNVGESSRELRVWGEQAILVALHTNCTPYLHGCGAPASNNFRFYDISEDNAADPQLILEFDRNTHEFYLWTDPYDPERALLFAAGAGAAMQIYDLSPLLDGEEPTTLYNGSHLYPAGRLHSLSVSNDGTQAYFALLTGGFAVADVSDFTSGVEDPELRRVTVNSSRPTWPGPGAHSVVKLWNRDWVYASDEVYGDALRALGEHGCPWGWARMIAISDPVRPTVEAEYRIAENAEDFCTTDPPRPSSSYSAHNPTPTPNIVFSSWHSGGMQAIGVEDPAQPIQLAELRPEPLLYVLQEDPALSAGQDKVVMWSYPIIKDGLIYVVDLRNGLYVLRYTGPFAGEVDEITFLEGNSNQGHAWCFEPVLKQKEHPDDPDELLIPEYCGVDEEPPDG